MPVKNVTVSSVMGEGMKIECRAGQHVIIVDQPHSAGGDDAGPSPLELYQMSLAACVSSIAKIVAKQRRISFRSINVTVTGELNTDVLLGKNRAERSGFRSFDITAEIDADMSLEEKRAFLEEVEQRCPVSENTANPTAVRIICQG